MLLKEWKHIDDESGEEEEIILDIANEVNIDIPVEEQILLEEEIGQVVEDIQEDIAPEHDNENEIAPQIDNENNDEQVNGEGLVVVRDGNIVSEEEDFVEESEGEDTPTDESEPEETNVVAAIDDNADADTTQQNSRPKEPTQVLV